MNDAQFCISSLGVLATWLMTVSGAALVICRWFNWLEVFSFCAFDRRTVFNRSALPITDTLLKLIAAAAIIGLSNKPKMG